MQRVHSGSPFEEEYGFCRALRTGDHILVAGTAPVFPDGSCPDNPELQARRCFEIVAEALVGLGASVDDVVRTRMYIVHREDGDRVGAVHQQFFKNALPVATMVVVAGLLDPRWLVEVEAEALVSKPAGD